MCGWGDRYDTRPCVHPNNNPRFTFSSSLNRIPRQYRTYSVSLRTLITRARPGSDDHPPALEEIGEFPHRHGGDSVVLSPRWETGIQLRPDLAVVRDAGDDLTFRTNFSVDNIFRTLAQGFQEFDSRDHSYPVSSSGYRLPRSIPEPRPLGKGRRSS